MLFLCFSRVFYSKLKSFSIVRSAKESFARANRASLSFALL